jgi:hypothetical protein
MWKKKNPAGYVMLYVQNITMSPITLTLKDSLNNLPNDIKEECIMAIKNKRSNQYRTNSQGNYLGNSNYNPSSSNNRQAHKGQRKKKNKSSVATMLSRVVSATKKVILKLTTGQG